MISEDEVGKIARLARLEIPAELVPVITKHLNSILGYVAALDKVDTSGVEPMSHVHGSTNVFRADVVHPPSDFKPAEPLGDSTVPQQQMLGEEALLKNAPDHSGRFIRVPLIVE